MENNYTNREEKPTPKYKKGDEAWFLDNPYTIDVTPTKCIITSEPIITLAHYKEPKMDKWFIAYRYKPFYCERAVRHTIGEEELYATEGEALQEAFNLFKRNVRTKVDHFSDRALKLGIDMDCNVF